jgi:DNA-binding PadR family transcriptional regulator
MKGESLGELEELVLLVIGVLGTEAYGVAIMKRITQETGREISISAIHTVLNRLEEKGYVASVLTGSTQTRGGRKKRCFSLTQNGKAILQEVHAVRAALFRSIPNLSIGSV